MSRLTRPIKRALGIFQVGRILWRGVIIAAPILIIAWMVYQVMNAVNSLGGKVLGLFIPERYLAWGTGILFVLVLILILGIIEVHHGDKPKGAWQSIKRHTVGRIPFFGSLMTRTDRRIISLEDLKNLAPCKFWLSDTTPHYGFIVNEQKVRGAETELDVYRPNVPTIVPGDLFPLKRRLVIKLGNSSAEILDKLASGGFIGSNEEIPIPWDDETEEGFKERINLTPLEIAMRKLLDKGPQEAPEDAGPA
jgi:uncharacterized membrane protein